MSPDNSEIVIRSGPTVAIARPGTSKESNVPQFIKEAMSLNGKRKFYLCLAYLSVCAFINFTAITRMPAPDLMGLGILNTGLATGLGVIVWGNVQEHRAKNGGG